MRLQPHPCYRVYCCGVGGMGIPRCMLQGRLAIIDVDLSATTICAQRLLFVQISQGGTAIADGEKMSWLLCSSKCAVTTALHSHSTFQRAIGVKTKTTLFSFIVVVLNCPRARLQPRPQLSDAAVTTACPPLSVWMLRNVCALTFGI